MKNYFYKDLYGILGIEPTEDVAKIKSAYRAMARKSHPDLHPDDSSYVEKFKEITEAYEILTDKSKKGMYDAFKGVTFTQKSSTYTSSRAKTAYKNAQTVNSQKTTPPPSDMKSQTANGASFSEVFDNILEGLFKEKAQTKKQTSKTPYTTSKTTKKAIKNGTDITAEVTITYLEALSGTTRTVNVLHTEVCPNCHGKMFINGSQCSLCKGTGETSTHKKITVKIPKNIKQNAKIRIANEGNRGQNGGKNGDVYLVVKIENDERYTFDGLNAFFDVAIQPYEAVFGVDISVLTPQGSVIMKIPANTANGQKFRLSSHGLKDGDKIGDAIVTAKIEIPKELTEEELALYKKLSEARSLGVRN